ncbi:MAG: chromosomal replication initiator protein DnaA [Ignavibacteria bacterium]|nr:chromosomal replication initiator protein DnaA [Ignavibacteria bacterium]
MDNLKFINLETPDTSIVADANSVWKNCLTRIKENVTLMTYNTWFLPIRPISFHENNLKVQLPNQFFWEWIDEHFSTIVKKTIQDVLGNNGKLSYIISDDKEQKEEEIVKQSSITEINRIKVLERKVPQHETNLNSRYKFENFIKGEGNQLARAAAGAISDNPGGTSFNPFFIYGGVGLGKTHLIQSIGNSILDKFPEKKVIYLSSDSFTVEFVEAIQSNKVNVFSSFYRSMDVLILDDIQFLMGKEKTQDLFFHIFNTLHQSRKQIILSSDKPPKDLKGLDDRLVSRFQWGLSADIQPPELEMRIAILKNKAEEYGMVVSTDILEFIAGSITSNIRELEGCLIKLLANASLNSKEITIDLAKRTVKEIATDRKINITIDDISKTVCQYLNIAENKIREKTRKKEIVLARQLAMYFSKELTKSSLKTIGLHFGGRDHSTVIHSCSNIEQMRNKDNSMKELIDSIRNKIELNFS